MRRSSGQNDSRTPDGASGEIEVRQVYEIDDFGDSATLDRFKKLEEGGSHEVRLSGIHRSDEVGVDARF
jgi:hypothetical protein